MFIAGFDNEKYLKLQSQNIKERISMFGEKLYLEFGGKLFDDFHASRVLPGFAPDSKITVRACTSGSMLTVDGADPLPFEKGEMLTVTKSSKKLRMVKLKKDGFYEVLRKKSLT